MKIFNEIKEEFQSPINKIKRGYCILILTLFLISCTEAKIEYPRVIPHPVTMRVQSGQFTMETCFEPILNLDTSYNSNSTESYSLVVNGDGVTITASTDVGLFYGQQTLKQLTKGDKVPYVEIEDEPRFEYRGLMVDVSRHFFDKKVLFKIIDELARYKMNRLHLHLTDAAGWRLEIDKYPKLTSETAFRTHEKCMEWWSDTDRKYVKEGEGGYGGYYTKEDMAEVVAYAAMNKITVIPEIEMPGHSEEVFVAYPELSCSGKPYVNSDFCIGNEATFEFVEGVLDEVVEMFPSEYIHIGGDEAGKRAWGECPKCKKKMSDNNLADVDELQSYMIKRVEKYLNSKGRKLLGWDEILQGGLAPDATVMAWRGDEEGIKAAKLGHDVIMSPNAYLYLDHYQADPQTEPQAIGGGYVNLRKAYNYNPVPDGLSEEDAKHVLGAQGNLWTEHIGNQDHLEHMLFPRLLAVAEINWTPQEQKHWECFKRRANAHVLQLRARDINAFELSYDVEPEMIVDKEAEYIMLYLDTERYPADIRYTLDGTMPTTASALYYDAIVIKDSANLVASSFVNAEAKGTPLRRRYDYHKAIDKPVKYISKLYPKYIAGGEGALTDGYKGGPTYQDGRWQGYTNSLECIIDMGKVEKLNSVSARFMENKPPCVFYPGEFEVLTSIDGENFTSQGIAKAEYFDGAKDPIFFEYRVSFATKARYVKIKASEAHDNQFIFIDEIVIW